MYDFVQPLAGDAVHRDSLDRRGEGIHSIDFTVDDLDEETARLVGRGVPLALRGTPETGGAFAYFDTRQLGNAMVKLIGG